MAASHFLNKRRTLKQAHKIFCCCSESRLPDSDEGLFAKRDFLEGDLGTFFSIFYCILCIPKAMGRLCLVLELAKIKYARTSDLPIMINLALKTIIFLSSVSFICKQFIARENKINYFLFSIIL